MNKNEAIERVKACFDKWTLDEEDVKAIQTLIPELAESEDERIRKDLIDEIKGWDEYYKLFKHISKEKVLAYLEKKKEQKSVECIEFDNEFKNQVSHLLASVLNKKWEYNKGFVEYAAQQLLGYAKHEQKEQKSIEDVVKDITKNKETATKFLKSAGIMDENGELAEMYRSEEQKPNIELIQRSWYMEGYHDGEFKREPKWILKTGEGGPYHEPNPRYGQPLADEQKSEESEDERIRKEIIAYFEENDENGYVLHSDRLRWVAWIEKQKEQKPELPLMNGDADLYFDEWRQHYQGSPTKRKCFEEGMRYAQRLQKPAEKQDYSGLNDFERAILRGFLCAGVENIPVTIIKETAQDCLAQIKPSEWSEEDENMINSLIRDYEYAVESASGVWKNEFENKVNWLKSLRPQPQWKPSEEQMAILEIACKYEGVFTQGQLSALLDLKEQLKKL